MMLCMTGLAGCLASMPTVGGVLGSVAGSVKQNDGSTTLLMIDNRSGVQLAAAEGSARGFNVAGWGGTLGVQGGSTPASRQVK